MGIAEVRLRRSVLSAEYRSKIQGSAFARIELEADLIEPLAGMDNLV
jgi:hypothetical protein